MFTLITYNNYNVKLLDSPRSHVAGVTWVNDTSKWKVSLTTGNKNYHICFTKDLTEAIITRYVFEKILFDKDHYYDKSLAEKYLIKNGIIDALVIK